MRHGGLTSFQTSDVELQQVLAVAGAADEQWLARGELPRRTEPWPRESLASVDACGLLGAEDVRRQLRAEATPYAYNELGSWGCGWDYQQRTVSIEFSRQGRFDEDDGARVDVGRDRVAVYEPEDGGCEVSVQHRIAEDGPDPRFEVALVALSDRDAADPATLCPGAIELAKAAVAKLP